MARYAMQTTVQGSLEEVKTNVIEALKAQGFGILTEIDVQKALKEKLGIEFEPYQILGACNPHLAYKALSVDRLIGLLLPCNVVLMRQGQEVAVSILDPEVMFEVTDPETKAALAELPQEARVRLRAALNAVEGT